MTLDTRHSINRPSRPVGPTFADADIPGWFDNDDGLTPEERRELEARDAADHWADYLEAEASYQAERKGLNS